MTSASFVLKSPAALGCVTQASVREIDAASKPHNFTPVQVFETFAIAGRVRHSAVADEFGVVG